jgi:hypothetical protein
MGIVRGGGLLAFLSPPHKVCLHGAWAHICHMYTVRYESLGTGGITAYLRARSEREAPMPFGIVAHLQAFSCAA